MPIGQFELPDVGEGVVNGEHLNWLIRTGATVEQSQSVAEVETDQAPVGVSPPFGGVVHELMANRGEVIPVGDVSVSVAVSAAPNESGLETEPGGGD